ncbi:hypothetical protein ACFX58_19665 [Sphingomonas sp. NCPPB 2930]
MKYKDIIIFTLLAIIIWLGSVLLDLSVENDGLKQVVSGHEDSIGMLLNFVHVAIRCDVTEQEVERSVKVSVSNSELEKKQVGNLAFVAKFINHKINEISIVGIKSVRLCE